MSKHKQNKKLFETFGFGHDTPPLSEKNQTETVFVGIASLRKGSLGKKSAHICTLSAWIWTFSKGGGEGGRLTQIQFFLKPFLCLNLDMIIFTEIFWSKKNGLCGVKENRGGGQF